MAQRHDNLRDLLTHLLSKICKPVEAEPHLLPVTNETLLHRTANTAEDARLDIKAHGFWQRGQTAFFDLRITHVNSSSQKDKPTSTVFKSHETAKKREYLERVIEIEHGTFTPLVFGTNGGMGTECQKFMKQLCASISEKTDESYVDVCNWLRTRISVDILKSAIMCVRGSRVPLRRATTNAEDFSLMNVMALNQE